MRIYLIIYFPVDTRNNLASFSVRVQSKSVQTVLIACTVTVICSVTLFVTSVTYESNRLLVRLLRPVDVY